MENLKNMDTNILENFDVEEYQSPLYESDFTNPSKIKSENIQKKSQKKILILADDRKDNIRDCKFHLIVGITISTILILTLIVCTIWFLLIYSQNNSHIILSGWEGFDSSYNITGDIITKKYNLGPIKILKGKKDWTTVTSMGLLTGDDNKIFFENNLNQVDKSQFDIPWWFRTSFTLDLMPRECAIMTIQGISYQVLEIWIDGKQYNLKNETIIGTYATYYIDVTNLIDLDLRKHYVALLIERPEYNDRDLTFKFGDFAPEPPDKNLGIVQPINIDTYRRDSGPLIITNAFINYNISGYDFHLEIGFHVKKFTDYNIKFKYEIEIEDLIKCKNLEYNLENNEDLIYVSGHLQCLNEFNLKAKFGKVKNWNPWELGEQNLYNLKIKILNGTNYQTKIGFRYLKTEKINRYIYSSKIYYISYNIFNTTNNKIRIKGATWYPDLFLRENKEKMESQILYAKHLGLNTIRLKGYFETDDFYSLCDKYGLFVILGWDPGNTWEEWSHRSDEEKNLYYLSLKSQLRRIHSHPSVLAFTVGTKAINTTLKPQIISESENILKNEKWFNDYLTSIDNSEGVELYGPYSWMPPEYYRVDNYEHAREGGPWGFSFEGGPGENPLRKGSYELVYDKNHLSYPLNESWNIHCGNPAGKYSKCMTKNFLEPLKERFDLNSFDDFQKHSALTVYENHKAMFEYFIYNSQPYIYASGTIIHSLNNPWPSNNWHLFDYFLNPSPAYFAVKKSLELIHIMFEARNNKILIINATPYPINTKLTAVVNCVGIDKKEILTCQEEFNSINEYDINSFLLKDTCNITFPQNDVYLIHLGLYNDNRTIISRNTYCYPTSRDVIYYFFNRYVIKSYANFTMLQFLDKTLLDVTMKTEFNSTHGKSIINISNKGKEMALNIELRLLKGDSKTVITPVFMSDNYFSLLGQEKEVMITAEFPKKSYSSKPKLEISGYNVDPFIL